MMQLEGRLIGSALVRRTPSVEAISPKRDAQKGCMYTDLVRDSRHDHRLKKRPVDPPERRVRRVPAATMCGVVATLNNHPVPAPTMMCDRSVTGVVVPRHLTARDKPVHL